MKLFPNNFQLLKGLIGKINCRADVFAIEIVFENMVDNLVALLYVEFVEVKQKTGKSSLGQFVELKVVFAAFENFKPSVEMEVFHLLDQNIVIYTKL